MSNSASLFSHFISTRGTFRWLSALVITSTAVAWVAVGFDIAEVKLFAREAIGLATPNEKAAHSFIRETVLKTQIVLLAATAIAFMTWLYRCRANLRAFGTRHLRYSRNWAVFGFLIPLVNFVRPYQVAREVWQASDPRTTDPFAWKQLKSPRLVQAWWGTFVTFAVLKPVAMWMAMSSAYDPARFQIAQYVELLADVMAALSVTFVYFVIDRITDAQEAKWVSLAPPPGT